MKKLVLMILFLATLFFPFVDTHASDNNSLSSFSQRISLLCSQYEYQEPSIRVSLKGTPLGLDYLGIYNTHHQWSVLGEFDLNLGFMNYKGTGTITNIPHYYYNMKVMVGHDIGFMGFSYIGIGTRFLHMQANHMYSSSGHWGYDRKNTSYYIPMGWIHRLDFHHQQSTLETTVEYDYFLWGHQFSELSAHPYGMVASDMNHKQTHGGYGINLSILYKKGSWGFGPYLKYWNINESEKELSMSIKKNDNQELEAVPKIMIEPHNITHEYGIKLTYAL